MILTGGNSAYIAAGHDHSVVALRNRILPAKILANIIYENFFVKLTIFE
jgi:hypothetical protein